MRGKFRISHKQCELPTLTKFKDFSLDQLVSMGDPSETYGGTPGDPWASHGPALYTYQV